MRFQRLIGLFLTGAFLLNYPILSIFSQDLQPSIAPILYLFGVWAGLIGVAALLLEGQNSGGEPPREG
ncbi:MAG: hypothetical protein ACO4AU_08515 [bacterium]|jgi:hypothetical protein